MKLNIGSDTIEIRDAIRQVKSNIKWLKCRVLLASKGENSGDFVRFYTQKIEVQEALIAGLSKHDRAHPSGSHA
jgi:hypothetical protein